MPRAGLCRPRRAKNGKEPSARTGRVKGALKAPDYGFRIGGNRKFFMDAKKPSVKREPRIKKDVTRRWMVDSPTMSLAAAKTAMPIVNRFAYLPPLPI